jgi:cellulose synthase/poly-beta-1,6-N-acetylglucosamine synthase-like glycosyltransferase
MSRPARTSRAADRSPFAVSHRSITGSRPTARPTARPNPEEAAHPDERACDASGIVREDHTLDPKSDLSASLRRVSPRFQRPRVAARSIVIYGLVLALWFAVLAGAWFAQGVFAWTAGLLYVIYDTFLLVHVARKTAFILDLPGVPLQAAEPVRPAAKAPEPPPTLGILIAAFNEAPALPTTIAALLPQLGDGDAILVVDDGSIDGTAASLASRFDVAWASGSALGRSTRHPGLWVLRVPHGGKARALNSGLLRLQADLVVTIDADTKVAADALRALRAEFASDVSMVAACCVLRPVCSGTAFAGVFQWFQTYEYIRAFCSRIAWMQSDALLLVSGAFAAFRREPLLTVGGFDAACLVEDYELIHRLHRYSHDHALGWRVRVLNLPRAVTDAPASLPSFLRQRRRWFAGFLQTQYWNCDMTFNGRYGSVGRWMLPIKAIDTMQPVFGLTAFVLLVSFAVLGRLSIVVPVLAVIAAKIVIDIGFHLWWLHLYGRWTGQRASAGGFGLALLSALAEPFSFQLLRHLGATWGWFAFLTRRHRWGVTPSLPVVELSP